MEGIPHMKPPWDDGSGPDYLLELFSEEQEGKTTP